MIFNELEKMIRSSQNKLIKNSYFLSFNTYQFIKFINELSNLKKPQKLVGKYAK